MVLEKRLSPALTVRRHVDLAFHGQEIEALSFALELARELLGGDTDCVWDGSGDLASVWNLVLHQSAHFSIIE